MPEARKATLEIFQDRLRDYRWRIRAANGRFQATSGEGFVTHSNARRAARALVRAVAGGLEEPTAARGTARVGG